MKSSAASRPWADAAVLFALKACFSALVVWSGFRAISDDDYARTVLAQHFVESPALDPSGTSWLPLPFYVYGGAMRLFGSSLSVARGTAFALGLVSALLGYWAAHLLGFSRRGAFVGATLGAVFPYAAYLGTAVVPEAPAAALTLLAAATLGAPPKLRLLGAAALFAATAARYEPWAVSLLFAVCTLWDVYKTRNPSFLPPAALAVAFPALWLLHGIFVHGDATFFVTRVAAYRAALGPEHDFVERLLRTPKAFVVGEPEMVLVLASFALPTLVRTQGLTTPLKRLSLVALSVVAFSMLADLRGTAATHHGERALLTAWLVSALLIGAAVDRAPQLSQSARRTALGGVAFAALAGAFLRVHFPREPFVDRRSAVAIGALAARTGVVRLAIDAPDYSFFAVQAGFGQPSRTRVLDDRDPRKPRPPDALTRDARALTAALSRDGFTHLALRRDRVPLAQSLGRVSGENADWALLAISQR